MSAAGAARHLPRPSVLGPLSFRTAPSRTFRPDPRVQVIGITGRLGLAGVILTDPRSQPLDAPSLLERKIARLLAGYREYLEQHLCFDDRNARRVLDVAGLGCPLLSAEVFNRLMEQALGHGWPADAGRAGKHPRDGGRNREPHRRRCVA